MFVRHKHNRSGSVSVQVIDKTNGYRVVRSFGSAKDPHEIDQLTRQAQRLVNQVDQRQRRLFVFETDRERQLGDFLQELASQQVRTVGPELIFGALYDRIGFNQIPDEMFRHLVIARLAYPTSNLKTADYLHRYQGVSVGVDTIYRFLDKLNQTHKTQVETIAYHYSQKRLGRIQVVFYDLTSLYFEAEDEDDLRKIGFSKDGKFKHPQIMLGLLVGRHGYPIGYRVFEGNTFEGHTLLPALKEVEQKYGFKKPIVVADAALLSAQNLDQLTRSNYHYIIGARIKNESVSVKSKILEQSVKMKNGDHLMITKRNGVRLIVTYSDKRAAKDAANRERGVKKLRERIKTGRLTKEQINNRGYNKFLALTGKVTVEIDEEKVHADQQWDGLKGYVTNCRLSVRRVIEHYSHLWQIEKAFRISKTDLRIRPIYHRQKGRIKAHVCVAFAAYTVYKELERLLKEKQVPTSVQRAAELTHTMYALDVEAQLENHPPVILQMDEEQQRLYNLVHQ